MLLCRKRGIKSSFIAGIFVISLFFPAFRGYSEPSASFPEEISKEPDPLWVQGKVLCEAGEYMKSLRFLTDLLTHTEEEKSRAVILFWIGKSWEGMGDFDRAQDSYHAALRLNPGLPEFSRILAVHQGNAIPLWDHVLSPKEENPDIAKASKPPFREYSVLQPPVVAAPAVPWGTPYQPPQTDQNPEPFSQPPVPYSEPHQGSFSQSPVPYSEPHQGSFSQSPVPYSEPHQRPFSQPPVSSPEIYQGPLAPSYLPPLPQEEKHEERKTVNPESPSPLPLYTPPSSFPSKNLFPSPQGIGEKESMLSVEIAPKPIYTPPLSEGTFTLSSDIPQNEQKEGTKEPLYLPPPPQEEVNVVP